MFDSSIIVQSAISAFNNAALAAPAFFWWAILTMPLFAMVYFCGGAFLDRLGWNGRNIQERVSLITVIFTLAWLVFFGGNYNVLRDGTTVLPFVIAAIVFVSSLFIGGNLERLSFQKKYSEIRKRKLFTVFMWIILFAAVGLSDLHTWWGPVLQMGAFGLGLLMGKRIKKEISPVALTSLVVFVTTVAVLMQPEFFRFGQLGALTPVHLIFLVLIALMVAAVFALRNVKPRAIIRYSAFIKLKWLARFISVLAIALFVLTESVPIFLGMTLMFFISFAMSIVHEKNVPDRIDEKLFAVAIGLFGVVTTMPLITALAVLYWLVLPRGNVWQQSKFLL